MTNDITYKSSTGNTQTHLNGAYMVVVLVHYYLCDKLREAVAVMLFAGLDLIHLLFCQM
jgi:hypothetical protein